MCKCITKLNERMKEYNSRIMVSWVNPVEKGFTDERVTISCEKINTRNRNKMGAIASYCPFCGVKYEGETK